MRRSRSITLLLTGAAGVTLLAGCGDDRRCYDREGREVRCESSGGWFWWTDGSGSTSRGGFGTTGRAAAS